MFRSTFLFLAAVCALAQAPFGLAIHGGAGNVTAARIGPEAEKAYRAGRVTQPFNTPGMFRAVRMSDGRSSVALFGNP